MKRLLKGFALAYTIRKTTSHENERWGVEISQPIIGEGAIRVTIKSEKQVLLAHSGRFAPRNIVTEVDNLNQLLDLKYILDKAISEALLMKEGKN